MFFPFSCGRSAKTLDFGGSGHQVAHIKIVVLVFFPFCCGLLVETPDFGGSGHQVARDQGANWAQSVAN